MCVCDRALRATLCVCTRALRTNLCVFMSGH